MKKTGFIIFILVLSSMLSLFYGMTPFSILFLGLLFGYMCRTAAQLFPEREEDAGVPAQKSGVRRRAGAVGCMLRQNETPAAALCAGPPGFG